MRRSGTIRKILLVCLCLLPLFVACPVADGAPKCGGRNRPPCPTPTPSPSPSPSPTPNTARIAVILVNFPDDPRQPWTTAFIDSLYDRLAAFYAESSFGQLSISADVFDYRTIQTTSCSILSNIADQADAGLDLSGYTHRAYIWPQRANCNSVGTGEMPGQRTWFNLSPTVCAVENNCEASFHLFPHEFGHNLGFDHAGTLDCTDASGGPVLLSDTCTFQELQDQSDVMGCCSISRLSNIRRAQAGWIPPSQVVTITQTTTVTLDPLDNPASRVYRVADGTGKYLYFENRRTFSTSTGWYTLRIRRAGDLPNPGKTELLNRTTLPVGASFTLPHAPVTITNVSDDGTTPVVRVEFN